MRNSVEKLNYPTSVAYGDKFAIEFSVNRGSLSTPKNLDIKLLQGNIPKGWHMEKLSSEQTFKVNFDSKNLGLNDNDFKVMVKYEDEKGNEYTEIKSFEITLTNVPPQQVPLVAAKSLIMKLGHMEIKTIVFVSSAIIIIFVMLIALAVRSSRKKRK